MLRNSTLTTGKPPFPFLNEVLSLNAQESAIPSRPLSILEFLNEVLSLNAQELDCIPKTTRRMFSSSMKS